MEPIQFHAGVLIVEDDPQVMPQHLYLVQENIFLTRQLPRKIYEALVTNYLMQPNSTINALKSTKPYLTRKDISEVIIINPQIPPETTRLLEVFTATNAEEAEQTWRENMGRYTSVGEQSYGLFIALLDHSMPGMTGLNLAKKWRPVGMDHKKDASLSPKIILYTGQAPALEEALKEDGYVGKVEQCAVESKLAEAVIHKGASASEFNATIFSLLEQRVKEIAQQLGKI